ncbi:MAG TPA: hypothetical protein VIQ30_25490 [Pseudonocardia sp.]
MADTTTPYDLPFLELADPPDIAGATEDLAVAVKDELVRIDAAISPLTAHGFQFVRKTADEAVTSNATVQWDEDLTFTAAASTRYLVEVTLWVSVAGGNSTTDFRAGWSMPTGANATFGGIGPDPAIASGSAVGSGNWGAQVGASTATLTYGLYTAGTTMITIKGMVTNGANTGTVRFAWSQANSSVNAVTVLANSYMKINKVS